MQELELTLFADYQQFYLQDDDERYGDLSDAWTPEATERLLAISDHTIGIGTARNMDVPVRITVDSNIPPLAPADWDKINRAEIVCDSGRIVVAGCTDYFPDATRIHVLPGTYEVVVAYRNLSSLSVDGLQGDDSYHIFLAPKKHVA